MVELKPYLSAYIEMNIGDIDAFVREHGTRIIIKSGVGSGKTHFVVSTLPTYGRTLYISSRIIIRDQIMASASQQIDKHAFALLKDSSDISRLDLCHQFELPNYINHLVGTMKYRYVVVDEIHALLSDTFCTAPYFLAKFLRSLDSSVVIVGLSACASRFVDHNFGFGPIDSIVEYFSKFKILDYSECTRHVKVPDIKTLKDFQCKARLMKANANDRILYFCTSTKRAYKLAEMLCRTGIRAVALTSNQDSIFGSFKKTKARAKVVKSTREKEREIIRYICRENKFPEEYDVVLTTTKLREGMNLEDNRIKCVISELKDHVSLVQCIGRVRTGVDEYCINVDINRFDTGPPNFQFISDVELGCQEYNQIFSMLSERVEGMDTDAIEKYTQSVYMETEFGMNVVREKGEYMVNYLKYLEDRLIRAEYADFYKSHERYISKVLGTTVIPCYGLPIDQIVEPYLERTLTQTDKKRLIAELHTGGYKVGQLSRLEKLGNYSVKPSKNYATYRVERLESSNIVRLGRGNHVSSTHQKTHKIPI